MITKNIKVSAYNNSIQVIFNEGTPSESTSYIDNDPTVEHIECLLRDLPTIATNRAITSGEAISILSGREQMDPTGSSLFGARSV